jgi:hypothetical protein
MKLLLLPTLTNGAKKCRILDSRMEFVLLSECQVGGLAMGSLTIEERRLVARRLFEALCAHYPDRYIALIEQPGSPKSTATAFLDSSMAENYSAVGENSFSELAASDRKATQVIYESARKGARFKGPA